MFDYWQFIVSRTDFFYIAYWQEKIIIHFCKKPKTLFLIFLKILRLYWDVKPLCLKQKTPHFIHSFFFRFFAFYSISCQVFKLKKRNNVFAVIVHCDFYFLNCVINLFSVEMGVIGLCCKIFKPLSSTS